MTSGLFYFDPFAKGLEVFLGPTEARLMELAWRYGNLTVKKALYYLSDEGDRAYTTVMTVLARLAEKGLLVRQKDSGRSFSYSPALTREQFIKDRLNAVTHCLRQFK